MAQPVWITPAGSLGTIPEGVFFQVPLLAYNPADPTANDVYYEVIAGKLPSGVQCSKTGLIVGVPFAIVSLQGVPSEVARDVVSKFAVRAYTEKIVDGREVVDRIADRTYTLTVTGQDSPVFVTPAGLVATYYDGVAVANLQITYTDTDPGDIVTVRLVAGQLPIGLTISDKGKISGFIQPLASPSATAGFDHVGSTFDQYPFDFSTRSASTNYEFTLEVTDGTGSDIRTFLIYVYSRSDMVADTTDFTADNTFLTADVTPTRTPIITTPTGSIGTVFSDNFFAFRFIGLDLDGDPFEFELYFDPGDSSIGLPGLQLDPITGWLYGYIPDLGLTEVIYNFALRVRKIGSPDVVSALYAYSLEVTGNIDTQVTWLVPADLGTINNGAVSLLYVAATNTYGLPLNYQLQSGSASSLPQGLTLLPSGDIAGHVSFNTFAMDLGTTTFDVTNNGLAITGESTETTFDLRFTFTVNAYSQNLYVSVFKTFFITVVREYNEPYENLYIQAMPPDDDRALISSLLQNQDIMVPALLFRADDPNFGRALNVVYDHAFGLTSATFAEYVSSLNLNHYWRNLTLGSIETAQALDSTGAVVYEVVYSRVIDNLVNDAGASVSKQVTLPYPINAGDSTEIDVVYPNSLVNMRDQVIDVVGKISDILPLWMISKQSDGRVLGFTPAWVIAYTKPGKSGQLAYNIRTEFASKLNLIDFEIDRYELDHLLSIHWDPIADSTHGAWEPPAAATTFDLELHYQLPGEDGSSVVLIGGLGYETGDKIRILGSQLGGVDGLNNVVITVGIVTVLGAVESANAVGFAPLFSLGDTYTGISGTNITGVGVGAEFDLEVVGGTATVFDGNSLKFIAPVDMYTSTTDFNKFLVFPKRTILA